MSCVYVCTDHVVQVDVGSSPDELLHDVQAALLGRQHERRLSVLLYSQTNARRLKLRAITNSEMMGGWERDGKESPYVVAPVHLLKAVQVGSQGCQVLVLHVAEEVLDGQRGHLDGRGGVHVGGWSLHPLLENHGEMCQYFF